MKATKTKTWRIPTDQPIIEHVYTGRIHDTNKNERISRAQITTPAIWMQTRTLDSTGTDEINALFRNNDRKWKSIQGDTVRFY